MRPLVHFLLWNCGVLPAETQTTDAERACLATYATGRKRLAEVGVWHGVTTRRLRSAMSADAVLYAVDPHPVGRLGFSIQRVIARREVGAVNRGRVDWVRAVSEEAARRVLLSGPVDFLFIDGDHSWDGIAADWASWSDGIGGGGIVALHDSVSTPSRDIEAAGSVRFTRAVVAKDSRYKFVENVDSLTVWRRLA